MGRAVVLVSLVAVVVFLYAGVAPASTPGCKRGDAGPDKMIGTARDDALCGEAGNDRITGRAGDDDLVGGSDNDTIDGDDGADKIKGGPGEDVIRAGVGDDVIRPGMFNRENDGARDFVACGPGVDTVYATGRDVVRGDCEARM